MNARPNCECHQEPATRKGDGWTCTIRNREANRRYHEANRERLAAEKRDARQTPGTAAFEESHHPPLMSDHLTGRDYLGPYTVVIEGRRLMGDEILGERDLPPGLYEIVEYERTGLLSTRAKTPFAERTDAQHRYTRWSRRYSHRQMTQYLARLRQGIADKTERLAALTAEGARTWTFTPEATE
jgi:hypothetical protein